MNKPIIKQSRIPIELQSVFLAAGRGEEVQKTPHRDLAFKVYQRWNAEEPGPRKDVKFNLLQRKASSHDDNEQQANEFTDSADSFFGGEETTPHVCSRWAAAESDSSIHMPRCPSKRRWSSAEAEKSLLPPKCPSPRRPSLSLPRSIM